MQRTQHGTAEIQPGCQAPCGEPLLGEERSSSALPLCSKHHTSLRLRCATLGPRPFCGPGKPDPRAQPRKAWLPACPPACLPACLPCRAFTPQCSYSPNTPHLRGMQPVAARPG